MTRGRATVRARGLGAELRDLRAAAGLSTRALAERLGWSASTISRIETGIRSISSEDVAALLVLYKVTGAERDRLVNLAKEADQPGWWETGSSALPPQLPALISFEAQATQITDLSMTLAPGLLQTPNYIRAVMNCTGVPSQDVETLVATRMGRQAILTRPEPPELIAIVDEAALRRPLGGPTVMAEQLRHIVEASRRPNITVQVLPFELGGHTGVDGPYMLLDFASARSIVHLEHKRSCLFVDAPNEVAVFQQATDTLREAALDPVRSAKYLATVAAEYEK